MEQWRDFTGDKHCLVPDVFWVGFQISNICGWQRAQYLSDMHTQQWSEMWAPLTPSKDCSKSKCILIADGSVKWLSYFLFYPFIYTIPYIQWLEQTSFMMLEFWIKKTLVRLDGYPCQKYFILPWIPDPVRIHQFLKYVVPKTCQQQALSGIQNCKSSIQYQSKRLTEKCQEQKAETKL